MSAIQHNYIMAAETAALQILADATGRRMGKDAMLGFCARPDAFFLTLEGTDPNDSALWSAHSLPAVPLLATAHGVFSDHAAALEWASRVSGALPVEPPEGEPLALLRMEGMGPLALEGRAFQGMAQEQAVWTIDINLRMVCRTGGKDV